MRTTSRLLAAMWHEAEDVAFVRACLRDDDEARDAWRRWIASGGAWLDPATPAGRRTKAFAPLVHAAIERHGLDCGRPARATLRAWRLHEQLRLEQYRAILRRALRALAEEASAGPSMPAPILLKGLALADTAYPHPLLRHCHDIDLLVAPEALPRAAVALERSGFTPRGDATLTDASGLPVVLHTQAGLRMTSGPRLPLSYLIPFDAVARAAARVAICGEPVAVLDRAHALTHVCLRGLLRDRGPASLRWMIDAWYLLAGRVPTTQAATVPADAAVTRVSWDRIRDCVREHRIGVPIAAAMTLLDAHVGAAVPRDRLDALIAEGARAPRGEHARVVARFATSCAASYVRRRLARTSSAVGPAGPVSSSG